MRLGGKKMIKQKIIALLLIFLSTLPIWLDRDSTMLGFALMIGIPMFFSKRRWFY